MQAKNKHDFRAKIYLFIAILKIIVSVPLAKAYNGIGCAIATSFSLIIGNVIIINVYYQKEIGIDILNFAKEILSMSLPVLISVIIGGIVNYYIDTENIITLGLKIVTYSFGYIVLMWFLGFNNYEKELFTSLLRK